MNATSVIAVLAALPSLIKLVRELMALAQSEYGAGTGQDKKAAVLVGVANVVGDETVWEKVKGIFGWIIDCIAIFKPKAA
jgi:hypothetical protein